MAAGVGGRMLGAVIREKDEELALFLQMRRRRDQEADLLLDGDAGDEDGQLLLDPPPPPPPPPTHAEPKAAAPAGYRMGGGYQRAPGGAYDFLHSDAGDKNDYDWKTAAETIYNVICITMNEQPGMPSDYIRRWHGAWLWRRRHRHGSWLWWRRHEHGAWLRCQQPEDKLEQ